MKLLKDPRYMLLGFGLAATLSIAALLGVHGYLEYQRQLATTEERLRSEARLLAEHAKLSIAAADFVLIEIEAAIQREGIDALASDQSRWSMIRQTLLQRIPHLDSLLITAADGSVRLTTSRFPAPDDLRITDREYFAAHRAGERRHIGTPVVGRSSGRSLIPVSLRLDDANGEFTGVVVAAMDVAYFQNFYTSEPSELNRLIGMYRRDGNILSLYPTPPGQSMAPLRDIVAYGFANYLMRSYIGPSPLDGTKKIIAFRQVDGYPVAISVATDYHGFVATLYPAWLRSALVFLLFSLGTGAAVYLIDRSMQTANRAREAQLKLARIQRETERLSYTVIRHMPNGWVAIVDPGMRYVFLDGQGSASEAIVPARIIGRTIQEVDPSETGQILAALVEQAFNGVTSERELSYVDRIYRATVVPLEDENQQIDHVLLLTQDITELKQAQQELEAHNVQLREISFTDGLLGIANRRAFDQTIAQEWRRAMRQQSPVALLMLDVDHFKLFNDTFGHTRGDEALRHLAELLKNTVARPGDLVARYGGEEFAVLLPGSDLEGALHLAEQIHARLAAAALPFPNAPQSDAITISIGAAAMRVTPDSDPLALIQQADAALYTAKKSGRNQTVAAADSTA